MIGPGPQPRNRGDVAGCPCQVSDADGERLAEEMVRVRRAVLEPRGLESEKILIVGGAGYIGSVLTQHLLAHGYDVRCLDCLLFNNGIAVLPWLSHPSFEFKYGDLTNPSHVLAALDGVTDVVLLGALVGDPITRRYPQATEKINVVGYAALLRLLVGHGVNKVVFVSTCSNYGRIDNDQLADEDFKLDPLSLYAISKVGVETALLDLEGSVDFAPVILRFATAFGLSPRMRFDLTVSQFVRDAFLGHELLVYDADTWRPYCHVEDFAALIRRVLEAPLEDVAFEVFNAGGSESNYTKQMIVDAISVELPRTRVRVQEHGPDTRNYRVDFRKVEQRLDFKPRYRVPDGIRELIAAMEQGLFHDIDQPRSFYGNHEIDY